VSLNDVMPSKMSSNPLQKFRLCAGTKWTTTSIEHSRSITFSSDIRPCMRMVSNTMLHEILYAENLNTKLFMQKVFLYDPTLIHNTSVKNTHMDGRQTDNNGIINVYSIAVSTSKMCMCLLINVTEQKFHANFDVENKSSRKWKFQGTKVTPMKLWLTGTKVLT